MKTRLFLILALLLSASLACNFLTGGGSAPEAASTQSAGESAAPTSAPQSGSGSAPTTAPEEPSQPSAAGNGEVTDITTFARSYKLRIYLTWQPENGETETNDVLIAHTSEPQAEHVYINSPDGEIEITQIGKDNWMCFDGECIYSQGDAEDATPFLGEGEDATSFFNDPDIQLKKTGTETINGFKATHYTVILPLAAVQDMAEGDASNVQSEVWIVEGNSQYPPFVVRWTASWDETREGVAGHSALEYEVQELDTDFTIAPPENAAAGGGGESGGEGGGEGGEAALPTYPGAQVIASMSGYSMMSTADDLQTVSEYYVQNLPASGWTLQSNDSLGGMVMQMWTKDNQTLTITIMPNDDGTTGIMLTTE